jgi:uncharacterized cupredoxin-like copper-binding protein
MMNRTLFSLLAAAPALVVSAVAFAAGQHSGDHPQHMQHGQQVQHMQHGEHDRQHSKDEQHGSEGQHGHSEDGAHGSNASDGHAHAAVNGRPGDAAEVSRVIDMTMDDTMRFTPDRITVKAGETVRFFLKNTGKVPHEFVIGSMDELREHAEMMRRMPEMKHEEANSITLAPRQIGGVVWQFRRPGTVDFACLVPGHFEAGMVGKVRVE